MKFQDGYSNLEWSKKLKALGVRQDTANFYWHQFGDSLEFIQHDEYNQRELELYHDGDVATLSVAELGVALPQGYEFEFYHTVRGPHRLDYKEFNHSKHWIEADTEANARAAMLCYLLENKIITVAEVNGRLAA